MTFISFALGGSRLILLAVVLIGMFLGIDPTVLLQGGPEIQTPFVSVQRSGRPAGNDLQRNFVAVLLADTEDLWHEAFRKMGRTYQEPKLVLFQERLSRHAQWPVRQYS